VLAIARRNTASAAGPVSAAITYRQADARTITATTPPAAIISNPPYGERLGGDQGAGPLEGFWRSLGAHLRTLDGHTAFLLCSPAMIRAFGMRPTWERKLRNGPLAVSLCRYELGRGGASGSSGARSSGSRPRRRGASR
jgi:putative N6-adenine-specific DNA methylase